MKRLLCILACVLCLGFVGCTQPQVHTPPDVNIDYSFEDDHLIGLCQMLLPNVVELRYGNSFATGFVYTVTPSGKAVIVTNNHLSGGNTFEAGHTEVRFAGKTSFVANSLALLGRDSRYDTVFLLSDTVPENAVDLRKKASDDNRMGQRVLSIGNGMGTGLAAAEGIIAQPDKIVKVGGNTVPAVQVTLPVNAGMSGSPLFNMQGELIGLNFAQTTSLVDDPDRFVDGVGYALPIGIVESLYIAACTVSGGDIPDTDAVTLTENTAKREFSAQLALGIYLRMTDAGMTVTGSAALATVALEKDDVIETIGDHAIDSYRDLVTAMLRYGKQGTGASLRFTVRRSGGTVPVETSAYKAYAT